MSNTDWEFVFDGIFGFLSSPIWIVPISSFIEEKSVVFQESEENFLAWTEVHKKYSNLVESLISSYLSDMGITDEQFLEACKMPSLQHHTAMKNVFEQLCAAEDFEIFKRMMIQKNVELQLQALQLIRKRQGKKSSKKKNVKPNKTGDEILTEVMKQTEKEYQEMQEKKEKEGDDAVADSNYDETMEKIISESNEQVDRLEHEVLQKQEETKQVMEQSMAESKQLLIQIEQNIEESANDSIKTRERNEGIVQKLVSPKKTEVKRKEPLKPLKVTNPTNAELAMDWIKQAKAENATASFSGPSTNSMSNEDNIDKREVYLIQQRNRLLELKKKEREKQLNQYTKTQVKARPSSARVAKQAICGEATQPSISTTLPTADELKRITMRKALAEKLKKEVIHK